MGQEGEALEVMLGNFEGGMITTHMVAIIQSERKIAPSDRFDLYIGGDADAEGWNQTR
jgi:hypothetical protein